uniref:Uncharacterized protein n=1 Tax=Rousettus aegyptiacus TaxID=9407 RepID=A0A7J8ILL2_ROUAE|nr:hypothetical protein HJG63_010663 [Rousettus aegyptiacus]
MGATSGRGKRPVAGRKREVRHVTPDACRPAWRGGKPRWCSLWAPPCVSQRLLSPVNCILQGVLRTSVYIHHSIPEPHRGYSWKLKTGTEVTLFVSQSSLVCLSFSQQPSFAFSCYVRSQTAGPYSSA